jgi:transposase
MITVDNAITRPVHRLEVFTGAGRRRTWSDEDKVRIVAEIVASGESVSAVARRHGLSPQQLFGWRRQVQKSQAGVCEAQEPQFVPAVIDAAPPASPLHRRRKARRRYEGAPGAGTIEVAISGVTVRIGHDAPASTIAAVLQALRTTA